MIIEDSAIIGAKLPRTVREAGADVVGPVATVASAIDAIVAPRWIDAALLDVDLGRHAELCSAGDHELAGMPLSALSNIAWEAPLGSLLMVFLLRVAVGRRTR